MTKDEALKLALEALEAHADIGIKSDKAITAINEALTQPEQEPMIRGDIRGGLVDDEQEPVGEVTKSGNGDYPVISWKYGYVAKIGDKFYTTPPAAQPAPVQEPVAAWAGYNLDDMCEAFDRVIEEHHQRKNPFHDPVNKDAMIALRILRGFVPYMKLCTNPPAAAQPAQQEPVSIDYDNPRQAGKDAFANGVKRNDFGSFCR